MACQILNKLVVSYETCDPQKKTGLIIPLECSCMQLKKYINSMELNKSSLMKHDKQHISNQTTIKHKKLRHRTDPTPK